MDFKLAKQNLQDKSEKITLKQIQEAAQDGEKIFYFSNENQHKDLLKLAETFQKSGRSAHLREAKFGLDEKEYIYELHII
ncbi:HP0268 family nuclease [Helicobacter pametensis]|uniref:HP0268 family nuclease n=1 Tax=Helicobacter pametensis TaxID=95149 RepID=UPI000486249A|nr:HP0268 family nuclease [Helicobacter pametensis]